MRKKFLAFIVTSCMIISLCPVGIYADSGMNSQKQSAPSFTFSQDDIERLALRNNVDLQELKDALMTGPDENGRYSPLSNLKQLDNDVTNEELNKRDSLKTESSETPIVNMDSTFSNVTPLGQVTRTDQDATAYVATAGAKTASGLTANYGMVAVHFVGGNKLNPIIPFGTAIYLDRNIDLPNGTSRNDFKVEDTGTGSLRTTYWIDIFFGGTDNFTKAVNFNIQKVTYNQMI